MENDNGAGVQLRAALERLTVHDHLCLIYETREEQFAAVVPFVRIGLERGERCIYIADDNTAQAVLEALRVGGIDTDDALHSGQLIIASKQGAYLKQGYFDPDWMIGFLAESTRAAKAAGYSALRVTSEMTWQLGAAAGVERLIEYEAKLNRFFPEYDALAMGQYDRARFSPEIICDVIRTHPLVIYGDLVCRNFYYVPPDEFLDPNQPSLDAERWLGHILERERVEQELREAERKYRAIFENATLGIVQTTLDGRFIAANPALAKMLGFESPAELMTSVTDIAGQMYADPDERAKFIALLQQTGAITGYETQIRRKDGGLIWVSLNARIVDGDSPFIEAMVADVTERKRATEALRESERKFRSIVEQSADGIVLANEQGNIVEWNGVQEQLTGLKRSEAVGRPVWDVLFQTLSEEQKTPTTFEHLKASTLEFLRTGQAPWLNQLRETEIQRPDGTRRSAQALMFPIKTDKGFMSVSISRDITERKRAEEALRESEQIFRRTFEVIPDPTFIWERQADGRIILTRANKAASIITRGRIESVLGIELEEFLGDEPGIISETRHVMDTGQAVQKERLYRTRTTQEERWVIEDKVRFAQDSVLVISKDITERKRAEEALRESEEKFRTIFESVPLSMIVIDKDGIMVEVSPHQVYHTAGGLTPREDYIGKSLITHPTIVNAGLSDTYRRLLTGESFDLKDVYFPSVQRGTEGYYFNIKGVPLFTEGEVIGAITVHEDITERKRAEETLQRYNQRLMILYDIDRDIVMARSPKAIVDTVLKHIRRLVPCWRANVVLYEPDTDEIVIFASKANGETAVQSGMRIPVTTDWVNRMVEEHYSIVEDTHTMPEPISSVVRMAIANGTRSFITTSMLAEGNLIGALVLGRRTPAAFAAEDIEIASEVANQLAIAIHQAQLKEQIERYAAELEKRVAQRTAQLESANRDLESFSYSVSHDLRAPLRAISGFAAIVARRHRADLNEEGRHYIDNIVLASERMGHLIDDLLQYSRLGRSGVRRERVSLREVLDPLVSDLAARLAEIGGTLSIADDLPTVMGDRTLLSQAFANLLENAITYRKPDIPVQVTVSCQTEDRDIIVCVGDNGIGISAEYHKKIFNIFQRLHSDDEYPGTGIGLSTVKKSVELLGGRVWVESVVGEGSTFYVRLPIAS